MSDQSLIASRKVPSKPVSPKRNSRKCAAETAVEEEVEMLVEHVGKNRAKPGYSVRPFQE
jgi:hypothetical protein